MREAAKRELETVEGRRALLRDLERDKDVLLESYADMMPEARNGLTPEERHRVYKMLRLVVVAHPDWTPDVNDVLTDLRLGTFEPMQTLSPRHPASSSRRPTTTS